LLTTTAPCGQYFFFNRPDFHHRAPAPRVMRVVSAVPCAAISHFINTSLQRGAWPESATTTALAVSSFTDKKPLKRLRLSQAVVNTQLKQGVNERVSQRPTTIPLLDLIDFRGQAVHTLASPDGAADPPFARRVASPFLHPLSLLPCPRPLKHHASPRFCLSLQRRNRFALRFRAGRKRRGSRQRRP